MNFDVTGFIKHNNIKIIEANKEFCKLQVELTEDSLNPYGFAHGGLIFSLGDTVMGLLCLNNDKKSVTMTSSIDYLKPGKGKYLTATSQIIRMGLNVAFLKANIYNDNNELIATMNGTYFYIK